MRMTGEHRPATTTKVAERIIAARDNFFQFMKECDEDFDPTTGDLRPWSCLYDYFSHWVYETCGWGTDRYKGPDSREFTQFNGLLPLILLAVIEELHHRPDLLDASPTNPDGTRRRQYHRAVPYLVVEPNKAAKAGRNGLTSDVKLDAFVVSFLWEPFPPVRES